MIWKEKAVQKAKEIAHCVEEEIVQMLIDKGQAPVVLNDYNELDWLSSQPSVLDESYNAQESVNILEELNEYEEKDNGLWAGKTILEALPIAAALTFRKAVAAEWLYIIIEINKKFEKIDKSCANCEGFTEIEGRSCPECGGTGEMEEKVAVKQFVTSTIEQY